ncbi:MAG: hypothetical protein COU69_03900 [Candidatus Pacebacteria bacterium CG10_big_fil_rev_8_21_14_0_10_56_10]|nr:MAG: hypothetical protein COU69_03900 [Candidatus Pacebacteria bacterium CG10_big_fil_rev_8_21_14_0_10_56_10]
MAETSTLADQGFEKLVTQLVATQRLHSDAEAEHGKLNLVRDQLEQNGRELDDYTKHKLRRKIIEVTQKLIDRMPQNRALGLGIIFAQWRAKEKIQTALSSQDDLFNIY